MIPEYSKYTPLIMKTSWSFHNKTGIPFEELVSVCNLSFVSSIDSHDPTKSTFITYFHTVMKNDLITFVSKEFTAKESADLDELEGFYTKPFDMEQYCIFMDTINNLNKEAYEVCMLILSSPSEFLCPGKPKLSRGRVYRYLRSIGWKWATIWSSFSDIKLVLNKV
jgi:hypothetical protein